MKNLKHFFTVLLLLCTTVVCAENVTIDGIAYSVNAETKQAEVVSNGWASYSGNIVIPSEVIHNDETYRITSVGNEAFFYCSGLTSIEIPNSVTSIGDRAFLSCSGLTSITIPNSVTRIGLQAFSYCSGLTNVIIPNSVTSIAYNAFRGCSKLESIIVKEGNPKYDSRENCNAIIETAANTLILGCKNSTISNSVTSIGQSAFSNCSGLTSIEIPNSVTSIGAGAFYGCEALVYVKIPEDITIIESETFCHCESLVSIDIPDNVTRIYESAFSNCYRLERILIPKAVTRIYNTAFSGCGSLESIVVETGNPQYDSRDNCNAIIETGSNILIRGCNKSTIPNGVVSIAKNAFDNCTGLTSIVIPNSVASIGNMAFGSCANLTNIIIPNDVANVESDAFFGTPWYNNLPVGVVYIGRVLYCYKGEMPSNTSVVVKDGTKTIAAGAFSYCNGLVSIEIPKSVTNIGGYAFYCCSALKSIVVETGNPKYDSRDNCNAIVETKSNTLLYGCYNSIIPNSVTSIGEEAFYGCSGLVNITIPNTVTSIGDRAFLDCTNLTNVVVSNSVVSIGRYAFSRTSWYDNQPDGLVYVGSVLYSYKGKILGNTTIVIKDGTTMISSGAFADCNGIISIKIPKSVTDIGNSAFRGCSDLADIEIHNSVASIGYGAFDGTEWYNNQPDGVIYAGCVLYGYKGEMPENTIVVIKDGTISITDEAFAEIGESLIGVKIPNSVNNIGEFAFYNTGISCLEIPEGVVSIGVGAFASCPVLTDIVIPSSVKSIREGAFYECLALTSIKSYIAKEDLFVPGNDVFYDVDKSKCTLYVPYGAKDVYASTAGWSDFLNICEFDATAIDDVQVEDTANPNLNVIYDLRGNRLTNTENLERGIYIINGQRVLIK